MESVQDYNEILVVELHQAFRFLLHIPEAAGLRYSPLWTQQL